MSAEPHASDAKWTGLRREGDRITIDIVLLGVPLAPRLPEREAVLLARAILEGFAGTRDLPEAHALSGLGKGSS